MSSDRWVDTRVERAAILAVERSILEHTDLITASPAVDFGIDLLAFQVNPFGVIPVQVKGAHSGLKVWSKYDEGPIVVAYVLEPLGDAPTVCIMSGHEAWNLPNEYVKRGGRASDHAAENDSYRWASVTKLLRNILAEYEATSERWMTLYEEVRAR